jgi:hypothetical protein
MPTYHIIYRQPGRFAGWPANYGMWHWDDEIVVVFTEGAFKATEYGHARDKTQPFTTLQARSLDGGISWEVSEFPGETYGCPISADEHVIHELRLQNYLENHPDALLPPPGDISFTHPDFALLCARTGLDAGTCSFFYYTLDRCHSWLGPYVLPSFGQTAVAARTAYEVEDDHTLLLFLTANKSDGEEGRVFCARTSNGGKTFDFVSYIGEEPPGDAFAIMPSHLYLGDGRYLCAIRCRSETNDAWIDLYASDDSGATWQQLARPVRFKEPGNSNPPSLVQLLDGRIALVYGNRDTPCTVCAVISEDEGNSWGEPVILRRTGGTSDMGYTRAVVLADGTIVAAYYLNDQPDGNGERFIEALRWQP